MKRTFLDRLIGIFSPKLELERQRYRLAGDVTRAYDAASLLKTSDWSGAGRSSANSETRSALSTVRDRSRDLVRNDAYAAKAINVIVNNTIGAGIEVKIKGRNKSQEKTLAAKWKEWAETTNCDFDGRYNFKGMQAAAMRSIVESGEVLGKEEINGSYLSIQLLEPDFINPNMSNNIDNVQGIWLDKKSRAMAYELYNSHPGDFRSYDLKSIRVPANQIIHAYRVDRIGQVRGMPWSAPVLNIHKDFADYQNATLIRQKVAACFTAFITEKDGDSLVDKDLLKARREAENSLEPATIRYLSSGQTVTFANPPGVDQYDPFARQELRRMAAGWGISFEGLTGDYSQVSFASGRMGHLEMQRNIDYWRWQMFIPKFCEPVFNVFLKWCRIQGIDVTGVTADWTPPAREMINPTEEITALRAEVRAGFKSLPEAIRERGLNPQTVLEETIEFNQKLDEAKLIFDTDPRRVTQQGIFQLATGEPSPEDDANKDNNDQNNKDDSANANSSGTKSGQ